MLLYPFQWDMRPRLHTIPPAATERYLPGALAAQRSRHGWDWHRRFQASQTDTSEGPGGHLGHVSIHLLKVILCGWTLFVLIVSLTMYRLCSSSEHHVSSGRQIVLLQLSHQKHDHAGDLGVLPGLVTWSAGRTRTEVIFYYSESRYARGNAYFWRRTFIISAPIWASCTRGLQRSCLDRMRSWAVMSSGKLDWKNFNNNQVESSRICTLKQEKSIFACNL